MNQQINLYQSNGGGSKSPLYLSVALFILFIVSVMVLSAYLKSNINSLRIDVAQQQLLLVDAETHTAKMKIKYPTKERNTLLEKRINQSQSLRQNLLDVMTLISDNTSDITQGFSRYFTAFSQQNTAGVWIKQVSIDAEKSSIHLLGATNNAESVPVFLQNLHNESIFHGKVFTDLNMDTDPDSGELSFHINTLLIDDTENPTTAAIAAKIKGSQ